jgi:hypothetical protein
VSRPARADTAATETIRVRVTPAERRDLEQVARQNHTDVSGAIRDAVNEYVADSREAQPAFRGTKLQTALIL